MLKEINESCEVTCECGHSLLKIEFDATNDNEKIYNKSWGLAMYYFGQKGYKQSLWGRIKFAIKYIRTGYFYSDQISLNKEEATKLLKFIDKTLQK